jgi:ankyrin repeat protein
MSDALPLPPRPNIEQYKKLARDLQRACKSGEPGAILNWAARWAETITRLQGLEITPEIRRRINGEAERIEQRWDKFQKADERAARCALADAQHFVARGHGFASWPKFVKHVEAVRRGHSPVSQFEMAADAIVNGDLATLERLILGDPELVRARSSREHRSTLLHYVSANGVEDFRQKTPDNIVAIAKLLLDAGADVNAESDAYGGRSTTLGLTATSCHPQDAGVQIPLMELLIERGAMLDAPDGASRVNACLHNGRGPAAEFLAGRGARLELEGAAGVGRLDIVKSFFTDDGALNFPEMQRQMMDGFAWACEFGRTSVVDFLLQRGVDPAAKLRHHGQTGLHWAAYGGHIDAIKLLLERGALVEAKDESYGSTPLGWALYSWSRSSKSTPDRDYYQAVALLVRAGAKVDPNWYKSDDDPDGAAERIRSDPRMQAALRGETSI